MPINENEPFNLHTFRTLVGDPARPYFFLVHIPEVANDSVMTAMARSTKLPGYELGETRIPFQGMNINIPAPPDVSTWDVSFLCDEAHELRRIFLRWQSIGYDMGTQLLGHSNQIKSDQVSVAQLSRTGQRVAIYNLVGAWPKAVDDIEVSHDNGSAIESFKVTFRYDFYVMPDKLGDNATNPDTFVRNARAPQISRGNPPPGNWQSPFNPQ